MSLSILSIEAYKEKKNDIMTFFNVDKQSNYERFKEIKKNVSEIFDVPYKIKDKNLEDCVNLSCILFLCLRADINEIPTTTQII